MSLQPEEEYQINDDAQTDLLPPEYEKEDKMNHVMLELRQYSDTNYLPFFKMSNTFTLFEKLINI
jgi:hypothetical protein